MSIRLFASDTHLGHVYMSKLRGFATVEEHDETVIANWNSVVRPEDIVFLAGDAALGDRKRTLRLFTQMNGTKHLITGNHDDCWPGHQNSWMKYGLYREVFASVQPFLRLNIDKHTVLVSHFPYAADHTDPPRYDQYRLRDEREWLLHGHTHSQTRRTSAREIHVGVDAWNLTPVAEYRIVAMMRAQLAREERERNAEAEAESRHTADDEGAAVQSPPDAGQAAGGRPGADGEASHPERGEAAAPASPAAGDR